MDLHLHQQQAHIINGDLIVRICSARILLEEIPSRKPGPLLPTPTHNPLPLPSPLNEMLLILAAASPAS